MAEEFHSGEAPAMAVSDDLRRGNVASVARLLLTDGPLARAEIADRLALTRATVTRVTAQLIEAGLVREGDARKTTTGRPMVPLELIGSSRVTLSVHLGATEVRFGAVDLTGRVLEERRHPYRGTRAEAVSELLRDGIAQIREARAPRERLLGVSASIGGWVDPTSQAIREYAPLGWRDMPLSDVIPRTGLPRRADQMVRGLALAERMFGVGRGHDDFVVLWSGNVIGAASVLDGVVQRGVRGGAGGIDHLPTFRRPGQPCSCGRDACLVTAVTDAAVLREARERGVTVDGDTLHRLLLLAADGDATAQAVIADAATAFGDAAGVLADLRAPKLYILAGLITTDAGYQPAFRAALDRSSGLGADIAVDRSAFGDQAPTIASAAILIDEYFRDPLAFDSARTPTFASPRLH